MRPTERLLTISLLYVLVAVAVAGGCSSPEPEDGERAFTYVIDGNALDSSYRVEVVTEKALGPERERELKTLIQEELGAMRDRISSVLRYSDLYAINTARDTEPIQVAPETFAMLRDAIELSEFTEGAFDITVEPLVNAWGYGTRRRPDEPPTDEQIERILEEVGYEKVELDPDNLSVRKAESHLSLDLSALRKGYGVERIVGVLEGEGISRFKVSVGDSVCALGLDEAGQPWHVRPAWPGPSEGQESVWDRLSVSGRSVSTSGDYRAYREVDGKRVSHTIDPRTGHPIAHRLASATVVVDGCLHTDGLATAFMVLGPEEGYALAQEHDLAVLFLIRDGERFVERASPAFERLLGAARTGD